MSEMTFLSQLRGALGDDSDIAAAAADRADAATLAFLARHISRTGDARPAMSIRAIS